MVEPVSAYRVSLARRLWISELDTIHTRLTDEDGENCVLCGQAIAEGPAWIVVEGDHSLGYAGYCCRDLAVLHGITREETKARPYNRPSHLGRVVEIPMGVVVELAERDRAAIKARSER